MLALLFCLLLQEPPLAPQEKGLLDLLLKDGLFDPAGEKAERVLGTVTLRTCYGRKKTLETTAWRVPAREGRPARFVLNNLQEVSSLEGFKPASFPAPSFERESRVPSFADVGMGADFGDAQKLVWVTWLDRLGRQEEAAKMLRTLNKTDLHRRFRVAFGWELFSHSVNAYLVGEDEDAVPALERLSRFESPYEDQGDDLLAELRRRRTSGSFGKPPLPLPDDLRSWPLDKRIERLIDALDQIDSGKDYPGSQMLDDQPPARELLACGEAAVPALLKCFEEDPRLTRAVGVWREWSPHRNILSVRGVALRLLSAVLRTEHWNPKETGPDDPIDEAQGIRIWSERLRRYWNEASRIPFPERMMRVLKESASTVEASREASENLARFDRTPSLGRWGRWMPADDALSRVLNPELSSFKDPTVAEAILSAMDRHLKKVSHIGNWGEIEEEKYLTWIGELGDRRIVPELRRRHAGTEDAKSRRRIAFALRRLGEPEPLDALAGLVEKGVGPRDVMEATALVDALGRSSTRACEAALAAIIRPKHPWYGLTRTQILEWYDSSDRQSWVAHPFCISFLQDELQDESATGGELTMEGRWVARRGEDGVSRSGFAYPERSAPPSDPRARKDRVAERACDAAAGLLCELIPDAPSYCPLALDSTSRLKELREFMERNGEKLRRMTRGEAVKRSLPGWKVYYFVADR